MMIETVLILMIFISYAIAEKLLLTERVERMPGRQQ